MDNLSTLENNKELNAYITLNKEEALKQAKELSKIFNVTIDELLVGKKETEEVKLVPQEERKNLKDIKLKIQIFSGENDKIIINLPMSLLEVALEMGLDMANVSGNENLKNVDLNKIVQLAKQGVIGNLMEIETSDNHIIKIFVE